MMTLTLNIGLEHTDSTTAEVRWHSSLLYCLPCQGPQRRDSKKERQRGCAYAWSAGCGSCDKAVARRRSFSRFVPGRTRFRSLTENWGMTRRRYARSAAIRQVKSRRSLQWVRPYSASLMHHSAARRHYVCTCVHSRLLAYHTISGITTICCT